RPLRPASRRQSARASACKDRNPVPPYGRIVHRRAGCPRHVAQGRGPRYETRPPNQKTREWLLNVDGQWAKAPVRSVSAGKHKPCGSSAPHARVTDKAEKDRSDRRGL